MIITGKNLLRVQESLEVAILHINNAIVTCPDPEDEEYEDSLDALEIKKKKFTRLYERVSAALALENPLITEANTNDQS